MKVSKGQVVSGLVLGLGGIGAVIYGVTESDSGTIWTGLGFAFAGVGIITAEGTDAQVDELTKRVNALTKRVEDLE